MRWLYVGLTAAMIAGPALAQTAAPAAPAAPAAAAPATAAPAAKAKGAGKEKFEQRFDAANTTHDGKLTLDQAKAGKLHGVVKQFAAIDTGNKGYVTKADVEAYRKAHPKEAKSL